ncbi:COXPD7 [Mytilus coruscus]|uniref:COXPD7 n=1 Tax=Mytilus coruscus TaxID=42192 RepID=A0A6J8BTA5_MYTCO|nr:COXPD7 [Mytilus coruscus]
MSLLSEFCVRLFRSARNYSYLTYKLTLQPARNLNSNLWMTNRIKFYSQACGLVTNNSDKCLTNVKFLACESQFYQTRRLISRKQYKFPELLESDLQEQFVRGGGPGGQAVAKTNNCCVLKHLPTGIVVRSHETRSLEQNRKIARKKMQEEVDHHIHGENSFRSQEVQEGLENRLAKRQRNRKRLERKKSLKEKLDSLDGNEE